MHAYACMHVYVLKVSYNKEKFLTSIVYHMCMHVCMGVHHMCICLKVPYIRRNSLQINYGVQFYCVSHVGVHHMCVCLKVPYIRRNSLQLNYGVQFYCVSHVGVHHMCVCLKVPYIRRNSLQINYGVQFYCVSHVGVHHMCMCMPESSLHKEKFLTNKILVSALCIIIHACMHVHGCACITCVYMF